MRSNDFFQWPLCKNNYGYSLFFRLNSSWGCDVMSVITTWVLYSFAVSIPWGQHQRKQQWRSDAVTQWCSGSMTSVSNSRTTHASTRRAVATRRHPPVRQSAFAAGVTTLRIAPAIDSTERMFHAAPSQPYGQLLQTRMSASHYIHSPISTMVVTLKNSIL